MAQQSSCVFSYVVIEERSDGSLVVAPDTPRPSGRWALHAGANPFSGMLFKQKEPTTTVPLALEEWGVRLREDELVWEFVAADVDGRTGFVAVTSRRLIVVAKIGRDFGVAEEQLLSSVRGVELIRRGMRHKLALGGTAPRRSSGLLTGNRFRVCSSF